MAKKTTIFSKLWNAPSSFLEKAKLVASEAQAKLEFQKLIMETNIRLQKQVEDKVALLKDVQHFGSDTLIRLAEIDNRLEVGTKAVESYAKIYKFLFGEDLDYDPVDTTKIMDDVLSNLEESLKEKEDQKKASK